MGDGSGVRPRMPIAIHHTTPCGALLDCIVPDAVVELHPSYTEVESDIQKKDRLLNKTLVRRCRTTSFSKDYWSYLKNQDLWLAPFFSSPHHAYSKPERI